jgi:hypothetical protein
MRRLCTFSTSLEDYLWQSDDEDNDQSGPSVGSTGLAAALPPPQPPTHASTPVHSKAAMALPPSSPRVDLARVVLPSNIHGVVPAARVAAMGRHLSALNRPAIRSAAQLAPTAQPHAPQLSVVDRTSCIAGHRSPTVGRPPARAATTRHTSDPYQLVRGHQRVAPDESVLDPSGDYTQEWRPYRVNLHRDMRWWECDHGIIDLRALFQPSSTAVAGTPLSVGFEACRWVLRRHAC